MKPIEPMSTPEQTDPVAALITKLNVLLADDINLHVLSFEFHKLAQEIRSLGLLFRVIPTLEYYLDDELTFLHHQEKKMLAEGNIPHAIETRKRKRQLLRLKDGDALKRLHREPSVFTYDQEIIIARLSKTVVTERLLINLIDGYNLRTRK